LWYDNYDATRWVVWLVDLVRERRDLSRVLRIGVCRSRQRRITAKKSATGAEIRAQSVLRPGLLFRRTAAVQQDLPGTDDRHPNGYNQALTDQKSEISRLRPADAGLRRCGKQDSGHRLELVFLVHLSLDVVGGIDD
jgi:hypothetical protein